MKLQLSKLQDNDKEVRALKAANFPDNKKDVEGVL